MLVTRMFTHAFEILRTDCVLKKKIGVRKKHIGEKVKVFPEKIGFERKKSEIFWKKGGFDDKRFKKDKKLTNWDVAEKFAFAFGSFTGDFLVFDCIKVVFFVPVSTKALTCRAYGLTVRSSLHIAPICVQTVFARFSHLIFVGLKFFFAHHFSAIVMSNNILVLNIRLDVLLSVTRHVYIIH